MDPIGVLAFLPSFAGHLLALSDYLYQLSNGVAGHSQLLDSLIALPLENQLVKAGIIGGCFLAAWHAGQDADSVQKSRRILLITLIASFAAAAVTKTLSERVLMPRPFIQSQKIYQLDGARLVESPRLAYHVPLDAMDQKTYHALVKGEINQNDLSSFPSDHAGFYTTLAVGIFLASRRLGWVAVLWTFFVTLGSRVITGLHSPLDIAAGSAIGLAILFFFQYGLGGWMRRLIDPVVNWAPRHHVFSMVAIFLVLFEAVNTLQDLRPIMKIGAAIVHRLIKG